MKKTFFTVAMLAALSAAAQVDSILRYPAETGTAPQTWTVERLYFQEGYEGTGTGIVKVPAAGWSTSREFRAASVRVTGPDTLLFKFETSAVWGDTLTPGKCNATDLPGTVIHTARQETTRKTDIGRRWYGWEILLAWPWDTAYTARQKPFAFFFSLKRAN